MNNVNTNSHQGRNLVSELLQSEFSSKLYDCIRNEFSKYGYSESEITYFLRSKWIRLDSNLDSVDVYFKDKKMFTVTVSAFNAGRHSIFTCTIQK